MPQGQQPPPPPPNGAPRLAPTVMAALVMVAMLVVGFIAGVAADRAYRSNVWYSVDRGPGPVFMPGMPLRPPPGGQVAIRVGPRPIVVEQFMRDLDLTPAQSREMDTIMVRDFAAVRSLREAMQPKVDSVVTLTRERIDSVLTPEQRVRYHELLERRRAEIRWTQPVDPPPRFEPLPPR